jgi:hypothetical protein
MEFYAKSEPGQRDNELHSIIGTEISTISPKLETYYGRYFTDRKAVLADFDKYSAVFKDVEDRSNQLSASLTALKAKIESDTSQYNSDSKVLNQDIGDFNASARSGGFASQSQFASARAALVARSATLEATRSGIVSDLATYEVQRQELQAASIEAAALNDSINSKLAPAPSL